MASTKANAIRVLPCGSGPKIGHGKDARRMAGRLQELHQVVPADRGGHAVDQRMIIQRGVPHHR
jgi:hypothetical protein